MNYVRLAEAAGIPGIRVEEPSQIGAAWDRALAADGPILLECMAGHACPRPSARRLVEQGS